MKSCEMKHEMTQWKCFVPDKPSFWDHIWSLQGNFSHKMTLVHLKVPYYHALTLSSNDLNRYYLIFFNV